MSDASDSQPPVERTQPAEGLPQPQQSQEPQAPQAQSPWPYPQQGGFPQQQGFPQQTPPQTPGFPQQGFPQQAYGQETPQTPGFPQQGFPQQAYGQEAQQPFPAPGFPTQPSAEPDWVAMAQEQEKSSSRRKRLYLIGGIVLGAAALAGIVFTTIALTGGNAGKDITTLNSPSPSPKKPAGPTTPLDVLSSDTTDTTPVSIATLFPAPKITVDGRDYLLTAHDTDSCTKAGAHGLGEALTAKGCYRAYRVTYVSGPNEITVGVFAFREAAGATSAKATVGTGTVAPLVAGKVTPFCQNVVCQTTQSSLGRFAYFTIAGPGNGKPSPDNDQVAVQAGRDLSASIHDTLWARGTAGLASLTATARPAAPGAAVPGSSPSH
ncbi:hypothetical protein GCM10009760_02610 [Kitasatospora kazusensis]|uniref:Serine/threonine protein kinase n=1 Tax=Kitasatospora kazusensis TaxID=407974 RepID=A0ABN2YP06_9ACTN